MSKITQKNKELKAKNKPEKKPTESAEIKTPNFKKCQTCCYHSNKPSYCRKSKAYCARKQDACANYKMK